MNRPRRRSDRPVGGVRFAVVVIVLAQWFGTSLWFSPSGASADLSQWLSIDAGGFGWLLAATQLGFIAGTLISTFTGAADRFAPERIFALASLAGALLNAAWILADPSFLLVWAARFAVGVTLAGIYPMGMKMIVQRVGATSGSALGWLVAMLTLGTAMPQILRALGASFPWQAVITGSSVLAVLGAVLIVLIADRTLSRPTAGGHVTTEVVARPVARVVSLKAYRASCGGYLGHMWELYAFWGVVPILCAALLPSTASVAQIASLAAVVIGAGSIGCVIGGVLSRHAGSEIVAAVALLCSGAIAVAYPLLPASATVPKAGLLILWGFFVIADSPQFSAMTAGYVPKAVVGTALTLQNCLGFLVTVISIIALQAAVGMWGERAVWLLVPGPLLGLLAMRRLLPTRRLVTT